MRDKLTTEGEPTAATAVRKPTGNEWAEAERVAANTLLKRQPGLMERAHEIARDAAAEASTIWRGDAAFSTLVTTIALRKAAKLAAREVRQKRPIETRARSKAREREVPALAPVFSDFMQHMRLILHDAHGGRWAGEIGATLRLELGDHVPFLLDHYGVPAALRPRFVFPTGYEDRVDAFARDVFAHGGDHWIESMDLLDEPLAGVTGRPPRDPYKAPADHADLQEVFDEQKRRHAGLVFSEKRDRAIDAVVRFAIGEAGLNLKLLNTILSRVRLEKKREDDRLRKVAAKALGIGDKDEGM